MEDLQSLLEKINRDGVEKADAEAKRIVDAAKARADAIVKEAREAAAKEKADAEKSAAEYAARAAETVRQGARDVILKVEESLRTLLERTLAKDVETALADERTACDIVAEAVRAVTGPAEVALPAKLVPAVKARLADNQKITVVMDDSVGAGFRVRTEGGRVESDFTASAIAEEIARRLRPDLAKLLK